MGNFKTVAAVTQAIKHVLTKGLSRYPEYENTPVTIGSPHQMSADRSTDQKTINLFLYHVRPDASLRNLNLPIYEGDRMVNVPSIGLDLYYLLSFYGPKRNDLESEYLLGIAVSTLNAKPLLQEADFRASRRADDPDGSLGTLDSVAVTPMTLTIEEMQRLWAMFPNTPYTLSMSYCASAALLVSQGTATPYLPVSGRPARPTTASGPPVLITLESADGDSGSIVFGSTLQLIGTRLRGPKIAVDIGGVRIDVDPRAVSADQIEVVLASQELRAGAGQEVRVLQLDDTRTRVLAASNALSLNIAPVIKTPQVEIDEPASDSMMASASVSGRLTVRVRPPPKPDQNVGVLLNQINGTSAYAFAAESGEVDDSKLSFRFVDVAPGRYLVRVQIDGVDSRLIQTSGDPFRRPRVDIPPRAKGAR